MTDRLNPLAFHQTKSSHDPKMIGLWKVGRTLGKGFSGHVRIARHSKTGQYAAIKIISKGALASRISLNRLADEVEHNLLAVEREIVVMKLIDHPNIMRLYDVWETSTSLYLILEYVQGGELFDYLCAKGRRPTFEVLGYFQQIICAVDYCHRFNIAHRDLKLENILIDQDANIKVADFGMATWQDNSRGGLLRTSCGSPHYAAPEIISGKPYKGAPADIWSCGVILYALLVAKLPFDDDDCPALLQKISIGRFVMPPDIDSRAQDLIWRMLTTDVRQRITMPEIMEHPFFTSQPLKNPKSMQLDPNVDSLGRPIGRISLIDPDIFVNLRTLWHGTPDSEIINSLMSPERNWQKGIYYLLVNYRKKYLEIRQEEDAFSQARLERKKIKQLQESLQRVDSSKLSCLHLDDDASRMGDSTSPISYLRNPVCNEKPPNVPPKSPLPEHLPQITVPEQDDPRIQVFFQQIADQLHVLQARSPDPNAWPGAHGVPSPNSISVEAYPHSAGEHPRLLRRSSRFHSEIGESGTKPLTLRRKPNKHRPTFVTDTNDKENIPSSTAPAMFTAKFALSTRGATSANGNRTPIPLAPAFKQSLKLQKTKPRAISPISYSDTQSSFSFPSPPELGSSPKRSWIDNVFNLKPATFTLLSRYDVHTTRNECRRLLVEMGLLISLEEFEKLGILKCRSNESKDAGATITSSKCVKFRVELQWPTPRLFRDGYVISLLLVHEKGPFETFKRFHQQLARDWNLDLMDKETSSTMSIDPSSTHAVDGG